MLLLIVILWLVDQQVIRWMEVVHKTKKTRQEEQQRPAAGIRLLAQGEKKKERVNKSKCS